MCPCSMPQETDFEKNIDLFVLYVWCHRRSEDVRSLELGLWNGCETCWPWALNPGLCKSTKCSYPLNHLSSPEEADFIGADGKEFLI